jgi:hypothetical protein
MGSPGVIAARRTPVIADAAGSGGCVMLLV